MSKPLHTAHLLAAAFITALLFLSTPAFATIVYTNGQDRTTPITSTDTLQVDNSDVSTQSGVISGAGTAITKTGSGILTLSGANTYSGATNLNSGILKAGADFVFSSTSAPTIHTGATLDLDGRNESIRQIYLDGGTLRNGWLVDYFTQYFTPQISSTGGKIENIYTQYGMTLNVSSGTTYLVGSVTGEAIVNSGTLNLAGLTSGVPYSATVYGSGIVDYGGTTQNSGPIGLYGGTVQNGNLNGRYSIYSTDGTINNVGGKVVVNAIKGTTTLRGTNNYSGYTYVTTGYVVDQSSVTGTSFTSARLLAGAENTLSPHSDMYVNGDATLDLGGFHQTLKSLTLNIPSLPVTPLPVPQQSILVVGLTDAAPALTVTGNATLGGRLVLNFLGNNPQTQYTVIKAGSITGEFASITINAPPSFTVGNLVYSPTTVTLIVVDTTPPPAPTGVSELGSSISSTVTSSNQASATIFDHLGESGSGDTGANSERDTLTFVSLTNKSISNSENTQAGLNGLVKALPEVARKNGGWFKGTGNLASVESSGTKAGFASESGGFMFGFDREVDKGVRIGAAGGYDHTSLSTFNGINANGETNSMRFAIYGSKAFEHNITLDAQIGYALHMIDGDRFESNTGTTATNFHHANEVSTGFQVSKKFNVSGFTFKPKAGINYAHVDEDGYIETGAGLFNATIASKSINSLRLSTGFGISHHMKPRDGFAFTPEVHIKYSYEALDSSSATSGSQRGIGFVSTGVEPSHHILTTGIGFSANLDDNLSAFGNYDVNLPTGNSFEQTFTLGMRISF